jgi:hypothetical protein
MVETVRVLSQRGLVRVELARWDDRLVVVKRLVGVSAEVARRLEREADVVRKLDHPNIVPLLATVDGNLVYAYVPAATLRGARSAGPLPVGRAVKILRDVLRALDHAHAQGVVHCDVKPANVLIKGERALLTDFGFAKDLALTAITGDQELLGTPNYMAPEQFQGSAPTTAPTSTASAPCSTTRSRASRPTVQQVLRWLVGDDRVPLAPLPAAASWLTPIVDARARPRSRGALPARGRHARRRCAPCRPASEPTRCSAPSPATPSSRAAPPSGAGRTPRGRPGGARGRDASARGAGAARGEAVGQGGLFGRVALFARPRRGLRRGGGPPSDRRHRRWRRRHGGGSASRTLLCSTRRDAGAPEALARARCSCGSCRRRATAT